MFGPCSLLMRRDISNVYKVSCWGGINFSIGFVENKEGRQDTKLIKWQKMKKRLRKFFSTKAVLDQNRTQGFLPTNIKRKSLAPGRDYSLLFFFLHERSFSFLHKKCTAYCRTPQLGKIFAESPFHNRNHERLLIHAGTCRLHHYLNWSNDTNCLFDLVKGKRWKEEMINPNICIIQMQEVVNYKMCSTYKAYLCCTSKGYLWDYYGCHLIYYAFLNIHFEVFCRESWKLSILYIWWYISS